jgi:hypothetical protein
LPFFVDHELPAVVIRVNGPLVPIGEVARMKMDADRFVNGPRPFFTPSLNLPGIPAHFPSPWDKPTGKNRHSYLNNGWRLGLRNRNPPCVLALKGHNNPAQGNALGNGKLNAFLP